MLEKEKICLEKGNVKSKMNPRFLADEVGGIVVWKRGKVMG